MNETEMNERENVGNNYDVDVLENALDVVFQRETSSQNATSHELHSWRVTQKLGGYKSRARLAACAVVKPPTVVAGVWISAEKYHWTIATLTQWKWTTYDSALEVLTVVNAMDMDLNT